MIHLRKKKKEEHTPKVKKKTGIIQSILNPIGFAKKLYDDDQVMTNAATITLFMVMSLFPMLMILLWLMSRMMLSPEVLLKIVSSVLPKEMLELVTGIVADLYEKSLSVSALSITIIMALWSSSTGISFLVKGLNRVYKREEQRNWFVHRALCLVYTGIFLVIMLLVMAFLVYGSKFRVFLVWMYVCMNIVLIGGEINFLYNNRYYYKLYLLTEKQIDIQEYFMHAKSETEILEPEVVDEEENIKEWEQEESFEEQKEAEILEEPQLAASEEIQLTESEEIQEQPDLSEKIE